MVTDATTRETIRLESSRFRLSRGFLAIAIATILVFVLGAVIAPSSVSHSAIVGMVPFAAVLAIAGLGQLLVVQQGGIDLSVAGGISLAVVIVTHEPNGDSARLGAAVIMAIGFALGAGLVNGLLVSRLRLNSIIATLGVNALLYGAVFAVSGGTPRSTTRLLARIAGDTTRGVPNAACVRRGGARRRLGADQADGRRPAVRGDRREPRRGARAGLRVRAHQTLSFVWAQLLYCLAGILLAGITNQPTAFQGDSLLLALGGGGRARRHLAARRPRLSDLDRDRGGVPARAAAVRAGARGRHVGADPRAGDRTRGRRRALLRRLVVRAAPAARPQIGRPGRSPRPRASQDVSAWTSKAATQSVAINSRRTTP